MNSKLLNHEEGKIKIDNIKNITLSDIINKKKKISWIQRWKRISII